MKSFLFLYPITQYFDHSLDGMQDRLALLQLLNTIIDTRYRQAGYQVCWLMFATADHSDQPDLSFFEPTIQRWPTDHVLCAELSVATHHKTRQYPSARHILAQVPRGTELVLGGFHQADCVERVARQAHRNGRRVRIDEDTTEQFFCFARLGRASPIQRTPAEYALALRIYLASLAPSRLLDHPENWISKQRKMRRRRPWLVMI